MSPSRGTGPAALAAGPGGTCAAGLPAGVFAVGPRGDATYRMAVRVPPGIAGTGPELSLVYDHAEGNGDLGVGWRLDGLSAITRVKATYAVDGFNGAVSFGPKDRFALDGHRLIAVDGQYGGANTRYATEVESYQKVKALGGELAGFEVTAKSGARAWYGTTADSRPLVGAHARLWAVSATEDLHGNRVAYEYTTEPGGTAAEYGALHIKRISYTAHAPAVVATRFVDFTHEPRPDEIVTASGGYQVRTKSRLARVTVSVGTEVVRSYKINYRETVATKRSAIASVVESGAAADGAPELPATVFTWQDGGDPAFEVGVTKELDAVSAERPDVRTMDVTGSGRTDLVHLWTNRTDGALRATTYLATGAGTGTTFAHSGTTVLGTFGDRYEVLPADVDGDGRTDLVVAYASGPAGKLKLAVFRSTGTGFAADGDLIDTGGTWDAKHLRFFAMDVNGDGRTDIVQAFSKRDPAKGDVLGLRVLLSEYGAGGTFAPAVDVLTDDPAKPDGELGFWPLDVTGDGMVDLVRAWRRSDGRITVATYLAASGGIDQVSFTAVHSDLGTFAIADQIAFLPVDVNADGSQDLVQIWADHQRTLHLCAFRSTGAGEFVRGEDSTFPGERLTAGRVVPMDLDGAGSTAIVGWWSTPDRIMFTAFRASPSGGFRKLPPFAGEQAGQDVKWTRFVPGDVNADGKADLIRIVSSGNQVRATPYLSTGRHLDVVETITDPLGDRVSISYAPLSDPGVYTSTTPSTFPAVSALRYPARLTPAVEPARSVLGGAAYVVSGWTRGTDPVRNRFGYEVEHALSYRDGKVDLMGRGPLGFAEVVVVEPQPGRRTTTSYHQDYPFIGVPSKVSTAALPGTDPRVPAGSAALLMTTTENTYTSSTNAAVASVFLTATTEKHFDYGETRFDFAIRREFAYDDYGNQKFAAYLGYVDPSTGEPRFPEEVVYRHRVFHNDGTANGYPRYEKVTRNRLDTDVTTFRPGDFSLHENTFADKTFDVLTARDWDDTAGSFRTTTYGYDEYGNRVSETPPGGEPTTHEFDPVHHTYRMRTTSPANGQGVRLVDCYGYDPRFGTEVAHLDANGRIRVLAHDPFGRSTAVQRAAPTGVCDTNTVPGCVTGTPELVSRFRAAAVLTVERVDRWSDGSGGQIVATVALQEFPTGTTRTTLTARTYVDGRGLTRESRRQSGQSGGDVVELVEYDGDGRVVSRTLPHFANTPSTLKSTTAYDVLGRTISHHTPAGADGTSVQVTTWHHGMAGVVTETVAAGTAVAAVRRFTHHHYDGADQVREVVVAPEADAETTTFAYDALGKLVRATDPPTTSSPTGVSTTTTYDSLGRRTTSDCPDLNPHGTPGTVAMRYTYDTATGLLSKQTDAGGGVTGYDYDHLRRIAAKHLSDQRVVAYTYDLTANGDGLGRVCRVAVRDDKGVEQSRHDYTYDAWGEISATTVTLVGENPYTTSVTRDPQRRVITRTLPDATVEQTAYSYGRLISRTLGAAAVAQPLDAHSAWGTPLKLLYGAENQQLVTTYTCAPTGQRLAEQVIGPSGVTAVDVSYDHDPRNRLTAVHDKVTPSESIAFSYLGHRLVGATRGSAAPSRYEYDRSGNLRGRDGVSYDYEAHFARGGSTDGQFVYQATQDACGRTATRTSGGETLTFAYDGFGALASVRGPGGAVVAAVVTDHEGQVLRRTSADGTVTLHIGSGYRITRTPSGQETVDRYLADGAGTAAVVSGHAGQTVVTYFRRDTKGSNTHAFDARGALVDQIAYDPFGHQRTVTGTTTPRRLFEDREWLARIGLYDFGGRYYDPVHGQFLTPDPGLGAHGELRPGLLNRFAFELNDPVNSTDPTGYRAHASAWTGGLLSVGFIVGGALVLGLTGGTGLGMVGLALLGGGTSGLFYSFEHGNTPAKQFWQGWAFNSAIGAALGAAGGAGGGFVTEGIEAAARQAVANTGRWRAGFALRARAYSILGVGSGALAGGTSQLAYNFAERTIVGRRDVGLFDSVLSATLIGSLAGGLGAVGVTAGKTATNAAIDHLGALSESAPLVGPSKLGRLTGSEWKAVGERIPEAIEGGTLIGQATGKKLAAMMTS
ncbi:RHS repeat-associated protein [Actinokineospora baliensis]|uniref:FG-GAP-like repeat-containing protein n=1 Tax=Actinokineospora baliensis TaxID=547056 RepID=UPI00195AE1BB|nr:FG-GAP-like repeat-containing protein [Actinokineospora baliensis]MBM7774741.1 RHS repeat-associated protein [Actinokineospora baliensis]